MIPSLSISNSSQTSSCWLGTRPRQARIHLPKFSNKCTISPINLWCAHSDRAYPIDGPKISLHPSCPDSACTAIVPKSP